MTCVPTWRYQLGGGARSMVLATRALGEDGAVAPCNSSSVLTLKAVAESVRNLENVLDDVGANCSRAMLVLDGLFSGSDPIRSCAYEKAPEPKPVLTPWSPLVGILALFGIGGSSLPEADSADDFADALLPTSVLAGTWKFAGPIVGRFSANLSQRLPRRHSFEELVSAAADDSAASGEENALRRQSLGLAAEPWENRWVQMNASIAAVREAEAQAEQRREKAVANFRARVLEQMHQASMGMHSMEELDSALTLLHTKDMFARSIGLLERLSLEAEDLQTELQRLDSALDSAKAGSSTKFRAREAVKAVSAELDALYGRVRSCYGPAVALPANIDMVKGFKKSWKSLNPFD